MRNMQQKFEALIENVAGEKGLEALIHKDYGNVGKILVQDDQWNVLVVVKFDWQPSTASLKTVAPGSKGTSPVRGIYVEYSRDADAGARIRQFAYDVVAAAAAAK